MSDDTYVDMSYHTGKSAALLTDRTSRVVRAKAVRTSGNFAAAMGAQIEREIDAGTYGVDSRYVPVSAPSVRHTASTGYGGGTITEYVSVLQPSPGAADSSDGGIRGLVPILGLGGLALLLVGGLS